MSVVITFSGLIGLFSNLIFLILSHQLQTNHLHSEYPTTQGLSSSRYNFAVKSTNFSMVGLKLISLKNFLTFHFFN